MPPTLSDGFEEFLKTIGEPKYAYSEDGSDYFVSEMFSDSTQFGLNAVLLFVQRKSFDRMDELVFRLPYLIVSRQKGYSDKEVETIRKKIQNDQIDRAFRYSSRFLSEFGKDI